MAKSGRWKAAENASLRLDATEGRERDDIGFGVGWGVMLAFAELDDRLIIELIRSLFPPREGGGAVIGESETGQKHMTLARIWKVLATPGSEQNRSKVVFYKSDSPCKHSVGLPRQVYTLMQGTHLEKVCFSPRGRGETWCTSSYGRVGFRVDCGDIQHTFRFRLERLCRVLFCRARPASLLFPPPPPFPSPADSRSHYNVTFQPSPSLP